MFYEPVTTTPSWRAVARFDDGEARIIYLGRSSAQVCNGFLLAFFKMLDRSQRDRVRDIVLERWQGADDAGKWVHQSELPVPGSERSARSA